MKNFIITILAICTYSTYSHAQEVKGKILINQNESTKIELKGQEVVNLYAQLRNPDIAIHFIFEGSKLATTTDGKQVSLIEFKTTIKHNGRVISTIKRQPMPFFPGSMFMPIETFDLISMLATSKDRKGAAANSKLAPGKYEVTFEANALDARGTIKPATLIFDVR